jgi:hypothetical protein
MSTLDPEVVAELARIKQQRIAREHRAEGVTLPMVDDDRQKLLPDVERSQNTKPETKLELPGIGIISITSTGRPWLSAINLRPSC